jgi:hypothetical protein
LAVDTLFRSFLSGGFECSTHRTRFGERLDLIARTRHDAHAAADYARLLEHGIRTARDGIRWHLIEQKPGCYDFSSVLPMMRAAHDLDVQVIWDLCHYGWPDDLDIFSPGFVDRFAAMAGAFTRLLVEETGETPVLCPVNEISFFSWAGGAAAFFNPFSTDRADELKRQLVRSSIAGIEAIWDVAPGARIVHTDPIINVIADPERPQDAPVAASYNNAQFDAWDMLAGRMAPELGGNERYLDIVGPNYYPHNQWIYSGEPSNPAVVIPPSHPFYRPFCHIIADLYERYKRPIFIAETGADGDARAEWLRYVGREVRAAMRQGVPVEGLCLYPIVNYPTWEECLDLQSGLWDYPGEHGERSVCEPLAREVRRQWRLFERTLSQVGEEPTVPAEFEVSRTSQPEEAA